MKRVDGRDSVRAERNIYKKWRMEMKEKFSEPKSRFSLEKP